MWMAYIEFGNQSLASRRTAHRDGNGLVVDLRTTKRGRLHVHAARRCGQQPSDYSACLRNEGGSVGTSIAQTLQERREQFHLLRLNEQLDLLIRMSRLSLTVCKIICINTPATALCRKR